MNITKATINLFNKNLRHETPEDIISFALEIAENPIVTSSFGIYSAVMLHAVTRLKASIPVIWCDTGYNTNDTYNFVRSISERLELNLKIYTPKYTRAYIENYLGTPKPTDSNHKTFSEWVKLEPFRRALKTHQPDVWFTNIRKEQTSHRDHLDILSFSNDGVLKVSPFYYFDATQIEDYLHKFELPLVLDYLDPVKAQAHRECGIHL